MRFGGLQLPLETIDGRKKLILSKIREAQKKIDAFVVRISGKDFFEKPDGIVEVEVRLL